MRTSILGLSAVALAAIAVPAFAQDAAPEANSDLTLTAGASVVTDYRFRGLSQNNEDFAVQGTLGVSHSSGFYVGAWGSSVDLSPYGGAYGSQEIDIYAGYKAPIGPATLDAGVVYYWYPNAPAASTNTDLYELYASATVAAGPASVKVGAAYAPKQKALNTPFTVGLRDDNLYLYGDVAYSLADVAPLTVKAHLGGSKGRSGYTLGLKNYLDWSAGVDYTWKNLTLGVSYVDTDLKKSDAVPYGVPYDMVDATFIGSITVAF